MHIGWKRSMSENIRICKLYFYISHLKLRTPFPEIRYINQGKFNIKQVQNYYSNKKSLRKCQLKRNIFCGLIIMTNKTRK